MNHMPPTGIIIVWVAMAVFVIVFIMCCCYYIAKRRGRTSAMQIKKTKWRNGSIHSSGYDNNTIGLGFPDVEGGNHGGCDYSGGGDDSGGGSGDCGGGGGDCGGGGGDCGGGGGDCGGGGSCD